MNTSDSIIFLSDKYGKQDKTSQIESIYREEKTKLWNIKFFNDERIFHYKNENVEIVKNALADKTSDSVFDYLIKMADFSEIKNESGQSLLVNKLEKMRFINEESALAKYLNPKFNKREKRNIQNLIFPFGCNNSQFDAVKIALENQISIIQGPPGTGKTQTILNIIANLLVAGKTVLVVSNNNAATANVLEKLSSEKYKMDFICATLGKKENVDLFLQNQKNQYPAYLEDWRKNFLTFSELLNDDIKNLKKFFSVQERIAKINSELSRQETEAEYFAQNFSNDFYSVKEKSKKSSSQILLMIQKLAFKYSEKEKFSFFTKFSLRLNYRIGNLKFWKLDEEKILATLKSMYYKTKKIELDSELKEKYSVTVNAEEIYRKCLQNLKFSIAKKYSRNKERIHFKDGKEIYFNPQKFAEEYPIVLSTTFSSRATLGNSPNFLYDYVIMDEASQVDVVTGALALSCAKNAVVVGDKMQLPNVIEESKKPLINEIFSKTNLPCGYNYINSFLSSLEKILPETPQTLLREHYRCHPKIINFCNQQFYGGKLLIMTKDNGEKDVLKVIKTVPGNFCTNHYNQRQIDIIKNEILPSFSQDERQSLGIIAPYNNQTDAIRSQIQGIDTATVHKYQGREKDNIIISTVDNEITPFADDSNLLNVSISRAKKKLTVIVSGNEQPKNSNLMALIKYIQFNNFKIEESRISSIFDFLFTYASNAKFEYLRKSKKISKFDTENAMNGLLSKIISDEKYSRFGFVFELPLKNIASKKIIEQLPDDLKEYANRSWSHVDFTIFNKVTKEILFGIEVDGYTYHKKGTKQSERDKKKDEIFRIMDLPLLRFSTRGANEETAIRKQLDKYC